jgi:hypothetical protein
LLHGFLQKKATTAVTLGGWLNSCRCADRYVGSWARKPFVASCMAELTPCADSSKFEILAIAANVAAVLHRRDGIKTPSA